ncbi:MAG: peptide-methionine (S)-S-oxide reductase MsrA [Flavobacteriaceae bacterium]|nr:peptide-methionine (S)-S-oxide reductase MsrA [Flavobacteriaceae bacterium]
MINIKSIITTITLIFALSCQNNAQVKTNTQSEKSNIEQGIVDADPIEVALQNGKAKAYFASGCFWCVEAVYESVKGVEEVINGYAGGYTLNPTYQKSNTGRTGHAEAVEVIYDPTIVDFATLVDVYFGSQNPTQVNGQGPDRGSQYRSIIFYQNEEQKIIITEKIDELAEKLNAKIAAEVYPFQKFWVAEDYHQNYERLHPESSYIQRISIPRLNKFKRKFSRLLKEDQH